MIRITCKDCGLELPIFDARNLGDLVTIKVTSCECNMSSRCDDAKCPEMSELKRKHAIEIKQLQEDVSILNKIIENVKKATEGDK